MYCLIPRPPPRFSSLAVRTANDKGADRGLGAGYVRMYVHVCMHICIGYTTYTRSIRPVILCCHPMKYLESDVMCYICIYACTSVMNFTLPVPRMNEMRFRQIGNRIMMMLKLMGSAGPRANARASYGGEIITVN